MVERTIKNNEFIKKYLPFLCLYLLIWTLAPTFLASSVALDVSEGINWGSEFQWGYYKHPPLSSWVLYIFYALFGSFGAYLLSQLCVLLSLYFSYQLGKIAFSQQVGLLASILTMGIYYYTYPTLEFNHNIAQFPIWSGLALVFYLAVTKNRWLDWFWLAVFAGLGMLTKYSVFFLLLPMALYLLYPKQWHLLKSAKPWLSLGLMLAIFSPHFYWLITHDWLPLTYAQGRGHNDSWLVAHFSWFNFTLTQLLVHIPLLVIVFLQRKNLQKLLDYRANLTQGQKLIVYLWLAPLLLLCLLSLVFGVKLKDMWGIPMWGLSGLIVASMLIPTKLSICMPKIIKGIGLWLSIISLLMLVYVSFGHQLRGKPSRMDWNAQALATEAQQTWQTYSNCPLDSVSGDRWLSALIAMNTGFPSQIFEDSASKTPWMSKERLRRHGTLLVWQNKVEQNKQEKNNTPPKTELLDETMKNELLYINGQWSVPWTNNASADPLIVNWAIYLPKACLNKR